VERRTGNGPLEGHKISVTVGGVGGLGGGIWKRNDKKNRGWPLGTKRVFCEVRGISMEEVTFLSLKERTL
jgi:hypothetical protein